MSIQTQTTKRLSIPVTKVSIKQKQKTISHHKETTLQCNQCDYKAATQSNLKEHIVATYDTIKPDKTYTAKRIKCDKCERKFNKVDTYEKHTRMDHKADTQPMLTFQRKLRSQASPRSDHPQMKIFNKIESSTQVCIN